MLLERCIRGCIRARGRPWSGPLAQVDDHGFTGGISLTDDTFIPIVVVPVKDPAVLVCPSSVVTTEDVTKDVGDQVREGAPAK